MSNIFNYDNKFFTALGRVVDCCILSALWFFFCIPIVTAGASSVALYYTVHKCVRNGKGYVASTFFAAFKENFKKSTLVWLIQLAVLIVVSGDVYVLFYEMKAGTKFGPMFYVFIIFWLLVMAWIIYATCYSARFEQTKKGILRNAALFIIAHLPWTFLMILIFVVSVIIYMLIPVLIFLLPAVVFILYNAILERIFRRYMSDEELAKEQEEDMLNDNV